MENRSQLRAVVPAKSRTRPEWSGFCFFTFFSSQGMMSVRVKQKTYERNFS